MSTIQELQQRTVSFLTQSTAASETGEFEALGAAPPQPDNQFVLFLPSHLERALAVTRELMEIANAKPGDEGLEAALNKIESRRSEENLDLLKYALLVFITHHPQGRRLPIPPLDQRSPEKIVPSQMTVARGLQAMGGLGPEANLDHFREDTAVNDHHNKWHVVYPFSGIPDPNNPEQTITKNRQGELFWYMHQQMIARYDAERKAFDLAATVALADYQAPMAEGYDANLPGYSNRPPNSTMANLSQPGFSYTVADHATRRDRLLQAAQTGKLKRGNTTIPITPALLGNTQESNLDSVSDFNDPHSFYGTHHNLGHVLIASALDPQGNPSRPPGVMRGTDTAVRDPIFFRWHKHVDEIFFTWQETLPENDFTTGVPSVRIRKKLDGASAADNQSPDILLAFQDDIAGASAPTFDGQSFGEATFGGAHWNDPPSSFSVLTNELQTSMREESITLPDGSPGVKPYLDHKEFFYFFRLENLSAQVQKVTLRVYLVPKEWSDDRRKWIEMDKFAQSLTPNQKVVVFRPARFSSVVRKPAVRPSETRPPQPPGATGTDYCDCGWPYHLLLPRGKEAGMDFLLMVMLTDHQADLVGAEKKCGSMSFCGARDADYPDSKPMGYPFDRPFRRATIGQVITSQSNMAARELKIRFTGEEN